MSHIQSSLTEIRYIHGCEVEPEVVIHEQRINGQTYYIAETTEDVDFEFKGKKLVKMWDVREQKTYYPDAVAKILKGKDNLLLPLYKKAVKMLNLYINNISEYVKEGAEIKNRNRYALNEIRKRENALSKDAIAIKKECMNEPPYTYTRPTHPEYIGVYNGRVEEFYTLNDARRFGIWCASSVKIYKKTSKNYQYAGTVRFGYIGKYEMKYFLNKNGAFQMNSDGSLAGALYRW